MLPPVRKAAQTFCVLIVIITKSHKVKPRAPSHIPQHSPQATILTQRKVSPVLGGVACPSSASEPWVVTTAVVLPDVVPPVPSPTAVLGK